MDKEITDIDRKQFFKKFKKLGWGNDAQSVNVFNFMMDAKKQVPSDSILLDLGAGQCRYKFFFKHCYYLAVDFAKGDSRWDYSKLDFVGDICNLGFIRDESVDFCLNTVTLEHLSEPSLFFAEIRRILKPAGRLFLYAPFVSDEHQVPYDFFRYTSYGLKHLCQKNGLRVISLKPSNGSLYTGIRLATSTIINTKSKNILINLFLKCLKGIFKFILTPLFDCLEVYSISNTFPLVWLLVAEKEGKIEKCKRYANKQQAIESITCKKGKK